MTTAEGGPTGHRGTVRDGAIAVLVSIIVMAGLFGPLASVPFADDHVMLERPGLAGLALLLAGTLLLAVRRVVPVLVLVANVVSFLAYQGLHNQPPPLPLGVLVALFTVAATRRQLLSAGATGVLVAAISVGSFTGFGPLADDEFYVYLISLVAALMVGYGVQLSGARMRLAEQNAAQLARDQDVRTKAAVEQEHSRIALEMHDIVAHHVSVIVAQAAVARRVLDSRPDAAGPAFASIEVVARDALQGMRRLVGLLRTEPNSTDRAPQPGLDRLPALIDQVRQAGLPVELRIEGEPRPLPAALELNAYRIVQEALTNSLKHAGPTTATIVLTYDAGSLHVEVRDGGRGGSVPAAGYGLLGMQQRVTMLDGELQAGSAQGQGFQVSARLPAGVGQQ
jgi:signal transduction histidine kinase